MILKDWLPTDNCYGWIDENNIVYFLENIYEHAEFFKNVARFSDYYQEYQDDLIYNEEIINDHLASLDDDEHPELHRFEGMDDESREALYYKVHKHGWIRFGVHVRNYRGRATGTFIEAYGLPKHLDRVRPHFHSLTKQVDNSSIVFFHVLGNRGGYTKYKTEEITN